VNLMEYLKGKRKKEGKEKWTEEKIKKRKEKKKEGKEVRRKKETKEKKRKKKQKNKKKPEERREEGKKGKKKKEEKSEEKKKERKEKWKRRPKKKNSPKLAPYSHQPTRLLLPSSRLLPVAPLAITTPTRQPVSSGHRQNSSLTHLLPAPGPGSGSWTSGVQTTLFSDVSVAGSDSRRRPSANN
jgi:hypothetical protein